jgi:membrane-bound metal-dependent hydrolase YbcI (DUF457 family)
MKTLDLITVADSDLQTEILELLLSLRYRAYQEAVRQLLAAMGYQDVRTHRRYRRFAYPRCTGGMDLLAVQETGLSRGLVIAQIKQYRRPVQRRFIDELRGAMLRTGARQGLVISTSTFPEGARQAATNDRLAPIRLVDGNELARLMIRYGIGIDTGTDGEHRPDRDYFELLREHYPVHGRRGSARVSATRMLNIRGENQIRHEPTHTSQEGGDMLARTHVLLGISSLWLVEKVPTAVTPNNIAILATAATFGALLPDLDAARSRLSTVSIAGIQPFAPVALAFNRSFGHRGVLHSPLAIAVVGAFVIPPAFWWGWQVSLALWLGYGSHVLADACTRTGVPARPFGQRLFLLPRRWRFATGSDAESLLFPVLAAATMLLLLSRLYAPR